MDSDALKGASATLTAEDLWAVVEMMRHDQPPPIAVHESWLPYIRNPKLFVRMLYPHLYDEDDDDDGEDV